MEKAYRMLRDRIFNGEYHPGERLKEREICADLEVSRTPVREALRRLEADGLVVIEPRRGGVVADIRPQEAAEIYSLGAVLESFAAKLAASRATSEELARLDAIIGAMGEALDRNDQHTRSTYMKLDSELHGRIVDMAENRRLSAALKQIVGLPVLVKAFTRYTMEDLRQSYNQHKTIVAALHARDAEWAESAMRYHILAARAIVLPARQEPDSPTGIQNL